MSEGMEFEDAMRLVAEIRNRPNTPSVTRAVARRYTFRAHHHVEGLAEPWCRDHWHDYTVEVVAELQAPPDGSMVIDTDELDRIWKTWSSRFEGRPQRVDADQHDGRGARRVDPLPLPRRRP
jgi:hypothetical protein